MSEKTCMFQYATSNKVLHDTGLITLREANKLFAESKKDFAERLERGEEPEMCIWINCEDEYDYRETKEHWASYEIEVINGRLYKEL